jgi:DNA (cytosine-5)-methyltransferase 1
VIWYNDNNAYACRVLRARVLDGRLPMGDVDERNIETIQPWEVQQYTQWHLFAGIGVFPLGLKWAGIPDHFRILTGGFPCQDISNAGLRAGIDGTRSGLWGEMARFIRFLRPDCVLVENVSALLHRGMERVLADLSACGYDAEWDCIPAAAVGAPHQRDRIFIVAYPNSERFAEPIIQRHAAGQCEDVSDATRDIRRTPGDAGSAPLDGRSETVADAHGGRCEQRNATVWTISESDARSEQGSVADTASDGERWPRTPQGRQQEPSRGRSTQPETLSQPIFAGLEGAECGILALADFRRHNAHPAGSGWWAAEPNVGRVADGVPARVGKLAGLGNAIVPQIAQFIGTRIREKFQI